MQALSVDASWSALGVEGETLLGLSAGGAWTKWKCASFGEALHQKVDWLWGATLMKACKTCRMKAYTMKLYRISQHVNVISSL